MRFFIKKDLEVLKIVDYNNKIKEKQSNIIL